MERTVSRHRRSIDGVDPEPRVDVWGRTSNRPTCAGCNPLSTLFRGAPPPGEDRQIGLKVGVRRSLPRIIELQDPVESPPGFLVPVLGLVEVGVDLIVQLRVPVRRYSLILCIRLVVLPQASGQIRVELDR